MGGTVSQGESYGHQQGISVKLALIHQVLLNEFRIFLISIFLEFDRITG